MCLLYALKLLKRHGGKLIISFQPNLHFMVCVNGKILHGTNRGTKGWRIEELDAAALATWFKSGLMKTR